VWLDVAQRRSQNRTYVRAPSPGGANQIREAGSISQTSFRRAALSRLPRCQRAMLAARPAESGRLLLLASSVIDHAQIGQFWGRSSDLAVWFAAASDQLFCWAFACCGLVVSSAGLGRVADVVEQGAVDLGAVGPGDRVRAARDDGGRAFFSNAGSLLPVASWGRTRS
jgi:hypothetical protein